MARRSDMKTLVDRLPASREARERTKVILLTLWGRGSVQEGCERLGVGRTRFQDLRRRMLEGAVRALEERPVGRPRREREDACPARGELEGRIVELEHELWRMRTELDLARSGVADAVEARRAARGARR